ncbi:haloacid dehalogenase-like hydrolase [Solibacillus sp. FSL K6-4121]|uniref:haloacid dehalogenase-like hydrolase n=1 Tax=Solibacillus sp. FSL K6-4121 TaxID=2921505 RepID=UPI0030F7A410
MNVYDFDDTIYSGDSTLNFYKFCLRKYPSLVFYIPIQVFSFILYKCRIISKLKFKQKFYGFLKYIKHPENEVTEFWMFNKKKIKQWYLNQKKEDDVIISASPEFLLSPICNILGIKYLIASNVDIRNGECLSENCYGIEKVHRFNAFFGEVTINEFYSDSLADTPLANLARKSYLVKNDVIVPWRTINKTSLISIFFNKEFKLFLIIGVINTLNGIIFAYFFSLFMTGTVAFILGYIISLSISYFLNTIIVFKKEIRLINYWKFCVSYIPNFLIQLILVAILLNIFGLNKLLVYSISAILGVPITFLMIKFFALKK